MTNICGGKFYTGLNEDFGVISSVNCTIEDVSKIPELIGRNNRSSYINQYKVLFQTKTPKDSHFVSFSYHCTDENDISFCAKIINESDDGFTICISRSLPDCISFHSTTFV